MTDAILQCLTHPVTQDSMGLRTSATCATLCKTLKKSFQQQTHCLGSKTPDSLDGEFGLLDMSGLGTCERLIHDRGHTDDVTMFDPPGICFTMPELPDDIARCRERIEFWTGKILQKHLGLDDEGVGIVIAGGAVLAALTDTDIKDVDIFAIGPSAKVAHRVYHLFRDMENYSQKGSRDTRLFRFSNQIQVRKDLCQYNLDVILLSSATVFSLLSNFDLPGCRFAYDGNRFLTIRSGLIAFRTRSNIIRFRDLSTIASDTFASRLLRYVDKGFSVVLRDFSGLKEHISESYKSKGGLLDGSIDHRPDGLDDLLTAAFWWQKSRGRIVWTEAWYTESYAREWMCHVFERKLSVENIQEVLEYFVDKARVADPSTMLPKWQVKKQEQ